MSPGFNKLDTVMTMMKFMAYTNTKQVQRRTITLITLFPWSYILDSSTYRDSESAENLNARCSQLVQYTLSTWKASPMENKRFALSDTIL